MATTIFNLKDADDSDIVDKIDIDDLYEKKRQADENNMELFNRILNRIHTKIKKASRIDKNATDIWYTIPEYIIGVPKYDVGICIGYIVEKLRDNGFNVRYFHPNTILISWVHWVPSYVREQVKKKLNKKIDGFGNIIEEAKDDDPMGLFPKDTTKQSTSTTKNNVRFKSTDSYKPTGKFIYNTDYFKQ